MQPNFGGDQQAEKKRTLALLPLAKKKGINFKSL